MSDGNSRSAVKSPQPPDGSPRTAWITKWQITEYSWWLARFDPTAAARLLALGLGIGAALAATPGIASADPVSPLDPNVAASVDGVTGTLGAAAVDPAALPDPDIAISFSGITLLQEGTAVATGRHSSATGHATAKATGLRR